MTLLVISPDYASHLLPLATLATAWHRTGDRVVVATGPATGRIVGAFGYERTQLQLNRGSNPGVIRAEDQPEGEDDLLRGFFDATRAGMVATLEYQARARLVDLMWQPVATARAVLDVVERVRPDAILVDHLAFSARLALSTAGIAHADVVLGHPTALPVGDEVYGYPAAWPEVIDPDPADLQRLRAVCDEVSAVFTDQWNRAAAELDPAAAQVPDAFATHGDLLLLNYPRQLSDPGRAALLPPHAFLGSTIRDEPADAEVDAWLRGRSSPFVYVSFGSFLSARADVLARVMAALRSLDVAAAVATGSAPRQDLGEVPATWLVREFLPQVRLLGRAAAAVTHGGNNSVTEAMTFGVPLVVMPFSTDQFAGAAAVVDAGVGVAVAPNTATEAQIADAVSGALSLPRARLAAVSAELLREPGPDMARAAVSRAR